MFDLQEISKQYDISFKESTVKNGVTFLVDSFENRYVIVERSFSKKFELLMLEKLQGLLDGSPFKANSPAVIKNTKDELVSSVKKGNKNIYIAIFAYSKDLILFDSLSLRKYKEIFNITYWLYNTRGDLGNYFSELKIASLVQSDEDLKDLIELTKKKKYIELLEADFTAEFSVDGLEFLLGDFLNSKQAIQNHTILNLKVEDIGIEKRARAEVLYVNFTNITGTCSLSEYFANTLFHFLMHDKKKNFNELLFIFQKTKIGKESSNLLPQISLLVDIIALKNLLEFFDGKKKFSEKQTTRILKLLEKRNIVEWLNVMV